MYVKEPRIFSQMPLMYVRIRGEQIFIFCCRAEIDKVEGILVILMVKPEKLYIREYMYVKNWTQGYSPRFKQPCICLAFPRIVFFYLL